MNGEESMTFMKLPKDLVLNCLARVSRLHYHTLSLVSKRFRSLLSSKELYQTRTLLVDCTENCLYVCLSPEHWFILCLKPNSSKKVLVPITSLNSPYNTYRSGIASVGSNIYSIGGFISRDKATSRVMIMDCHSHTWREVPSMRVAREVPSVCVLDEKIHVIGGYKNLNARNWMEVFDTKTQRWELKWCGNSEKVCNNGYSYQSIVYDGNVYVHCLKSYVHCLKSYVVHKLHEGSWIRAGDITLMGWSWHWSSSACVIGNVLYTCTFGGIVIWYDSEVKSWKEMKGLERSFASRSHCEAKLADSGGKLAICWVEYVIVNGVLDDRKIWCGEISIVKRQEGEIWGKLEWSDIVFTTNEPFKVGCVLAVTL